MHLIAPNLRYTVIMMCGYYVMYRIIEYMPNNEDICIILYIITTLLRRGDAQNASLQQDVVLGGGPMKMYAYIFFSSSLLQDCILIGS